MNLKITIDLEYLIRNSTNEEARKIYRHALGRLLKKA